MARAQANSELQESFLFMNEPTGGVAKPPFNPKVLSRLAAEGIFLGTSSWKYRGWEGLIYRGGYSSEAQFQRVSLREYSSYFPCVGVDFTYYAWPQVDMMNYLLESTPENFRLYPKVTKRITLSSFPDLPAYGKWAGKINPEFLDADLFCEQFLSPISHLKGRLGAILFEFSGPAESEMEKFVEFFGRIPKNFPYAVEIRNAALVNPDFYRTLISLGISPAFSTWTKMPRITEQLSAYKSAGGLYQNLPLLGLGLLKPGRAYEDAVRLFQPYQELRDIYAEGRQDLIELIKFAKENHKKAIILVANRLEGSAPHTIGALVEGINV